MTDAKFTPGPWRVGADLKKICLNGDDKFTKNGWAKCVATAGSPSWMGAAQSFHNAHLIAAAPELYEALQNLRRFQPPSGGWQEFNEALSKADLALAKARGES